MNAPSFFDSELTQDGSRVFFETQEALVSEDTNTAQTDWYMWSGGQLTLISEPG